MRALGIAILLCGLLLSAALRVIAAKHHAMRTGTSFFSAISSGYLKERLVGIPIMVWLVLTLVVSLVGVFLW